MDVRSSHPEELGPAGISETPDDPPIELARALRALRHSRGIIAVLVLAVMAATLLIAATSDRRYRATADLVAEASAGAAPVDPAAVDRQLSTIRTFATSATVLGVAAAQLPGVKRSALDRDVTAAVDPDTNLLSVSAVATDPGLAARIANAVADALVAEEVRVKQQTAARAQKALEATIARLGPSPDVAAVVEGVRARLSAAIADESTATADVRVAEGAIPPTSPFAPRPLRSAVLAALAALLIGVLAALARDRLQPRVDDARSLGRALGLPLLAVTLHPLGASRARRRFADVARLPEHRLRAGRAGRVAARILRTTRRAAARHVARSILAADAEDRLMRTVRRALPSRNQRILLVSGITPRSGAGHVAASLATALAQSGRATLFVHADLGGRRDRHRGGSRKGRRSGTPRHGMKRPWAVAAGPNGLDVGAIDGSTDVDAVFARLRDFEYAYVVVHGPAVTDGIDFSLVARHVRAAIVVGRVGHETFADAAHARHAVDGLGLHALGVVATADDPEVPARAGALDRPAPPRRRAVRGSRAAMVNGDPADAAPGNGHVDDAGPTYGPPPVANG